MIISNVSYLFKKEKQHKILDMTIIIIVTAQLLTTESFQNKNTS